MTKTTQPAMNKRICAAPECNNEFEPKTDTQVTCCGECSKEWAKIQNNRRSQERNDRSRLSIELPITASTYNRLKAQPFGFNDFNVTPRHSLFNPFHGPCGKPLAQWPPAQPENKPAQGIVDV